AGEAGPPPGLRAARRDRGVALVRDRGPIGDEYAAFLRAGLDSLGVAVAADLEIADASAATTCVDALRRHEPPCVVYLGLGPNGVALCRALRASGWTGPVVGNIGLRGFPGPALWGVGCTDVVGEGNPVLPRFAPRWPTP